MTEAEMIAIVDTAFAAASAETARYLSTYGHADACGFAWAVVAPGTSKLARLLKTKYGASKAYGTPGMTIWNPSKNYTQCITAKEMGAKMFANKLTESFPELRIYWSSRMD